MGGDGVNRIEQHIKAWAFPLLLSLVGVYLYGSYQKLDKLSNQLEEIRIDYAKSSGRIDNLQLQITYLQRDVTELKVANAGKKQSFLNQ